MLDFVLGELRARKGRRVGNLRDVSRDTDLDYSWLTKLANEPSSIPDPGVNKIQKLYDYLREEQARAA